MKVDFEVTASSVTVKRGYDKKLRVDVEGANLKEFMEYVSDSDILKEIGEANIAFWFNNNDELYIEKFLDECHEENLAEYLESKGWKVER
ncbi:hypothetical protein GTE46_005356 [Salmonella enterica subsp. enterica]|nr:hypothetical protein [Salmonella enterica subsp. enterica]EDY2803813.1 hypothetical protein [Salmonella enterica subsp. enterica]